MQLQKKDINENVGQGQGGLDDKNTKGDFPDINFSLKMWKPAFSSASQMGLLQFLQNSPRFYPFEFPKQGDRNQHTHIITKYLAKYLMNLQSCFKNT